MSKRELWNEMADWLTDAFSFFERCLSNWKNFRVKVSGLVRLRPTVILAFRDMYQIHWGLLTCLGMRDIYSGAYMSRNPRHILTSFSLSILSDASTAKLSIFHTSLSYLAAWLFINLDLDLDFSFLFVLFFSCDFLFCICFGSCFFLGVCKKIWRFFVCSPQRVCWSPILD